MDDHGDRHGGGHEGQGGGDHGGGGPVGSIAGGTEEVLDGIAGALGEEDEDAKKGLETAGEVAGAVQDGAKTAEALQKGVGGIQGGDVGDAASGLGGAIGSAADGVGGLTGGIGSALPEGEVRRGLQDASRVANTVGQVARGAAEVLEGGAELFEGLLGERHEVHYHLEVDGSEAHWQVHHVQLHEGLGEMSACAIEASCPQGDAAEESDLLAKDIGLVIERGDERRSFRGIIRHADVRVVHDRNVVHFDAAPALWLAAETLDSRIYQDRTVPDLVEEVVQELVGSRHRTVRRELTEKYPAHEYLVQHRESHWAFLKRVCEEEGIFLYFDHDEEDREVLVLGDSNDNRPQVRPDHDGAIEFEANENQAAGREVATHVSRHHRVSATDVVVRGYDWTNPDLSVHHERTERGAWEGPRLERYHHDHAVRHHEYDEGGGSYRSHTADRYSRMHTERLDIQRHLFTVQTTVVTAMPGHTFELQGADIHDGRYLILSASLGGQQNDHGGELSNTLTCIPVEVPYRPPEPQRQRMPGPETATVVGPSGEEIHCDKHGRIKVQFHWDRQGQSDEHSSAWIRVNYGWAGPGWGQIFIPRIGMEVIVAFLGGDPDRPLVMGAVYNGKNPPPYPLPDEKTKSTIKTNSSLNGDGYNELRFEDKKGQEEVFIHAEKDFNEVVEHDHSTHVKNDQSNTVDHDQTETIGNDQSMTVGHDRTKTVAHDEWNEIGHYRSDFVDGNEDYVVRGQRARTVKLDDLVTVEQGDRKIHVQTGEEQERYDGGRQVEVKAHDNLDVDANRNTHVSGQYNIKADEHFKITQSINELLIKDKLYAIMNDAVELKAGNGAVHYQAKPDGKLSIKAATEIELVVGGSTVKITSSGIEINAPDVKINGATKVDVTGGLVRLKP